MKVKLFLTFALLLTAVTGAWADLTPRDGDVWDEATMTLTVNSNPDEDFYAGESDIQHLVIASGVTTIGDDAFRACTGLMTVAIPASVTYIGSDAFFGCTKVTDVYCDADPAALTWEEYGCDDFKYDGTTIIHVADADSWYAKFDGVVNGIFRDPSTIPFTWAYDPDTKTLTLSGTEPIPSYRDPEDRPWNDYIAETENIVIENGVKSIGNWAISYCTSLTTITIPASVRNIGKRAFYHCTGLTTVTIPASVTYIGNNAFYGCTAVTDVYCSADPAALTWDENGCNDFKSDGSTIIHVADAESWYAKFDGVVNGIFRDPSTIPFTWAYNSTTKTLTLSGADPMPSYDNLEDRPWNDYVAEVENIVTENGVKSIGKNAFSYCSALTSVTIPASVKSIGEGAFYACTSLSSITIPANVTSIGKFAFQKCTGLSSITIPASVTSIASTAFNYCSGIATMTVEDGNESYDSPNGCNAIIETSSGKLIAGCKSTTIPDGVLFIGEQAFSGHTGLTTVTIPASVTDIGNDAFYDCTGVTDVYCNADPAALTWNEGNCDDFKYDGTTIIHVTDAETWIAKFGGVVNGFFRDPSTIPFTWAYNSTTKTLTLSGTEIIPSCVKLEVRPWNDKISEIEKIVIENGVKGIGRNAFTDCSALTSVTIPASVTFIGDGAFSGCISLTTVTFDGTPTLTRIGDNAFSNCNSLTSITIPASLTSIGYSVFSNCNSLTSVTLNSNPYMSYGTFDGIPVGATVTMNLTGYEGATGENWMTFCSSFYNFQADTNTKVFTAALSDNSLTLTELKDDKIVPQWEAVILKSTSSSIVMTLTATNRNNDFSDNWLRGVYNLAGLESDGNIYALNKGAQGVGFYKLADGSTLGYGKAYLWYSGSSSSNFIGFDGETTSISEELRVKSEEFAPAAAVYDLQGRRVAQPAKGLYIVNGKKVVIK